MDERFLALLEGDRIDHRLALDTFQAGLDHRELRTVDHDGNAGDIGLGRDQIEEGRHGGFAVEQAFVHVDIDHLGAVLHLVAGDRERGGVIAIGDELPELGGAGDVGAFAHIHERDFRRQRERLQSRQAQVAGRLGYGARRLAGDGVGDGADMRRRRAAAAADDVDQARGCELAHQLGHIFGALVVEAELVGQTGIGIGADERIRHAREFGDVGAHFLGAEGAVQPDRERRGVADRIPERFGRLAGQHAAGEVRDGAGDHDRHADAALVEQLEQGIERRLEVERVEHGLEQEDVGAAVEKAPRLLRIGFAQQVEGDGTIARIGHVGRNRGGAIGGSEGAGDEALTAVFARRPGGRLAGQPQHLRD